MALAAAHTVTPLFGRVDGEEKAGTMRDLKFVLELGREQGASAHRDLRELPASFRHWLFIWREAFRLIQAFGAVSLTVLHGAVHVDLGEELGPLDHLGHVMPLFLLDILKSFFVEKVLLMAELFDPLRGATLLLIF